MARDPGKRAPGGWWGLGDGPPTLPVDEPAERSQVERDAEAGALGFVAAADEVTQAERRGYCKGWGRGHVEQQKDQGYAPD